MHFGAIVYAIHAKVEPGSVERGGLDPAHTVLGQHVHVIPGPKRDMLVLHTPPGQIELPKKAPVTEPASLLTHFLREDEVSSGHCSRQAPQPPSVCITSKDPVLAPAFLTWALLFSPLSCSILAFLIKEFI